MSKRPPRYYLKSQHVLFVIARLITSGRLRQIARKHEIGFLEADSLVLDDMKPEKEIRYYCEDDIQKIIASAKKLTKAVKNGELHIEERLATIRELLKKK